MDCCLTAVGHPEAMSVLVGECICNADNTSRKNGLAQNLHSVSLPGHGVCAKPLPRPARMFAGHTLPTSVSGTPLSNAAIRAASSRWLARRCCAGNHAPVTCDGLRVLARCAGGSVLGGGPKDRVAVERARHWTRRRL